MRCNGIVGGAIGIIILLLAGWLWTGCEKNPGASSSTSPHPTQSAAGQGGLLLELWRDVPDRFVQDLTSNPSYPKQPSSTSTVADLQLTQRYGDFYGVRLRGWLTPPATGKYRFWIASDDEGQLWLSPDDKVEGKEQLCYTPEFTAPQRWDKRPEQQSRWVSLAGGRRYYLEVLMKQEAGGECLAVAWEGPGFGRQVIREGYLSRAKPSP